MGSVSLCTCPKPLTQTRTDKWNCSASLSADSEYIRSEHSLQQSSPWHLHAPYQHRPLSFFWAGRRIQVNLDTCNPTISDSFTRGDYKDTNFPKTRANSLPLFLSIENDDAQTSCVTFEGGGGEYVFRWNKNKNYFYSVTCFSSLSWTIFALSAITHLLT